MLRNANGNRAIAAVLLATLAATGGHAAPNRARRDFPVEAAPVLRDRLPQTPVALPRGVKVWRDVVYQTQAGFRPQVLDIYVPATPGPHPLVLYIHGGGWQGGSYRRSAAFGDFPRVLAGLALEGFTVASLEYRLSGEARFPAQLRDVNAALRFLRAEAPKYRIDPARVGLWGGSAGGHLAAQAALACRNVALDPAAANDTCAQTAVAWYGVFDLAAMPRIGEAGSPEQRLIGCEGAPCAAEPLRAASPLSHIDASDPPFLLIHGEDDKDVPIAQSRSAEAAMRRAGVAVRSLYIADVDHSFIGKTPEATRAASMQAINATFDFLHEQLDVPRK